MFSFTALAAGTLTKVEANKDLRAFNDKLKDAYTQLPKRYGSVPADEKAGIDGAAKIVANVLKELTAAHKAAGPAFDKVKANAGRLNEQIGVARKAHAVSVTHVLIRDARSKKQSIGADIWQRHDTALDTFRNSADAGWKPVIKFFEDKAKTWQAEIQKEKDAVAVKSTAMRSGTSAGGEQVSALRAKIAKAKAPVKDEAFNELLATSNRLMTDDKTLAGYYRDELQHLRAQNGFLASKATRGQLVADALGAGLVKTGIIKKKRHRVTIKAEGDWCYAVAVRATKSTKLKMKRAGWSTKTRASLIRFSLDPGSDGLYVLAGVCVDRATTLNGSIYFTKTPSKKSGIKYVTVGWPRSSVPRMITTEVRVKAPTSCDYALRTYAFVNALPETVIGYQGQPHLIERIDGKTENAHLVRIDGVEATVPVSKLTETPKPDADIAELQYQWEPCKTSTGKKSASSTLSQYSKCVSKVKKVYGKKIRSAKRALKKAGKSASKKKKAKLRIKKYTKKLETAMTEKCEPLEGAARTLAKDSFDGTVAEMKRDPTKLRNDRVERLDHVYRARKSK